MPPIRYPPGPHERFPGELLLAFNRDPTGFLTRVAQEYGDLVYFPAGFLRVYLLNHPDLIQDLFVTHNKTFVQGYARQRVKLLFGDGLITSEGEAHLDKRRLMAPLFHRQQVESYADDICRIAAEVSCGWRQGVPLNLASEMWRLTLRITAKTLFDTEVEHEAEELNRAVDEISNMFNPLLLILSDWLTRIPNPARTRLERSKAKLYDRMDRIIQDHRAGKERSDLLAMLLATQYDEEHRKQLTYAQVRDEALEMFMAGHGTIALALAWTLYLLAQDPAVEQKLEAELASVLGSRLPTAADLGQLTYTRQVLAEGMRLYPPTWALDRQTATDYRVGDYTIPAGSQVLVSQWVTHHDPRYFPDPFRFDPSRFTSEQEAQRPRYAYFPFGGGPRLCVGEHLAWMEGTLLLATIAQQWRFHTAPGYHARLRPRFSLESDGGIWLTPEPQPAHQPEMELTTT